MAIAIIESPQATDSFTKDMAGRELSIEYVGELKRPTQLLT
jgi:hypothetical protein